MKMQVVLPLLSFSLVSVANGLEISPKNNLEDSDDDIDFTQAVLDPHTGLMCVYNQGLTTFRKMSALCQHNTKHLWVSMIIEKFTFLHPRT